MSQSTSIQSGDTVAIGSPAQRPCLVIPSPLSSLAVGTILACDPGDNLVTKVGGGLGAESIAYMHRRTQGRVIAAIATGTWSPAPSVTHKDRTGGNSPTGPSISLALDASAPGCLDDHQLLITPIDNATNGVARANLSYDGASIAETITIPPEGPAVLTGTVDLAAASYPLSGLNGKHLDFTAPASKVITWASAPTSAQDVVDAFNTLAAAAPLAARARLAQGTGTDLGKIFFELYSTSAGAGVTMTLDLTASDADTVLGLSTSSTTGTAATYPLPRAGLVATFTAGNYVAGETYVATCRGPRCSNAAIVAAATAATAKLADFPFGFIVYPAPLDTAGNAAALLAGLEALRTSWLSAAAPADIYFGIGAPWHTPSSSATTNESNIATADQALLTGFANAAANPNSVVNGEGYVAGSLVLGNIRRSAVLAWAAKRAAAPRLAATVAEGTVGEWTMVAADGATYARNENTATVKLAGLDGPGFFVLKLLPDGRTPKFDLGATRAGSLSRLRHDGDVAVVHEVARLTQAATLGWEGERPEIDLDTGMMVDHEKNTRQSIVFDALQPTLRPDQGLPNCSDFGVFVLDPPSGRFVDNGETPVKVSVGVLGTITDVIITVAATGTTIDNTNAANG